MNAILLCAGLSTRLRPLTNNNPKCLIKFSEINLLEFWINKLINLRVNKILINTHFKHKKIFEYINNHKFKDRINLTYEKKLLGTAGTLIRNSNFFNNNDGLLIHCDNYTDANLDFFLYNHKKRPKQCLMSMLTFKTRYPKGCGIVKYNQQDRVLVDFFEKPKKYMGSNANGAIYCISKKMIHELNKNKFVYKDFSLDVIPKFKNKIFCIHTNCFFTDIGDINNLNFLRQKKRYYVL